MGDVTRTIDIIVNADDATKSINELNKSLDKNQEEIDEVTDETKKYQKVTEDASKATSGLVGYLDKMTGGLISSAKGTAAMVKGLKAFRIALAATGIGALIVAIGSLVQYFKSSEAGQDRLNKIMRAGSVVIGNLTDVMANLGEAIYNGLINPLETAKKAWASIKDFFTDPIGSIKRGWEEAKDAVSGFIDETKKEIEQANVLSDLEAKTNKLERQFWVDQANALAKISELRLKASEDEKYSADQRAGFIKEALALNEQIAAQEAQIAQNRLDIIRQSNEFSLSNKEALDEAAQAERELINIQTQRDQTARRLQNELQTVNNELEREVNLTKQLSSDSGTLNSELAERITLEQLLSQELNNEIDLENELADINAERLAAQVTTTSEQTDEQNKLSQSIALTTNAAKGLLDVFQGKVEGKDIFKTVLGTLGSILSIVLPGSSQAIAGISGLVGGLFADGGLLKGPSHDQGGIWVNAEGGEGIINKRSMSIPWIKDLASELNQIGGGVKFADGGIVPTPTSTDLQLSSLQDAIYRQQIVLPIPDLLTQLNKVQSVQDRATL